MFKTIERKREYYRKWWEDHRESERKRCRLSFHKRYKSIKAKRKYNTPKVKCRALLSQAVFYGKIIKPDTCETCNKNTPKKLLHGHHDDYTKPYDVKWLCSICHGFIHRKPQEALKDQDDRA